MGCKNWEVVIEWSVLRYRATCVLLEMLEHFVIVYALGFTRRKGVCTSSLYVSQIHYPSDGPMSFRFFFLGCEPTHERFGGIMEGMNHLHRLISRCSVTSKLYVAKQ